MNIGCLFGTFDPPHKGHVAIARHMLEREGLDEVWLVITPRSPFKPDQRISADHHRVAMARLAVKGIDRVSVCEEELRLPAPNYTVITLAHFRTQWPEHRFSVIIGSDNLAAFDRWKDPEGILATHPLLVYPRPGSALHLNEAAWAKDPRVHLTDAPLMDISSTRVRQAMHDGKGVDRWLQPSVRDYAATHRLYSA